MIFRIVVLLLMICPPFTYAAEPKQEQPYKVEITGVEGKTLDKDLLNTMEGAANLFLLIDKPPSSSVGLIRRAASDKERMFDVLKSFGYYAGKVSIFINDTPLAKLQPSLIEETDKPKVVIKITPGNLYTFDDIQLLGLAKVDFDQSTLLPNLKQGDSATGSYVVEAEGLVLAKLELAGYPYATIENRKLLVNHDKKTMNVTLRFTPGPRVQLGELAIKGLEQVADDFVRQRTTWQLGDTYSPDRLEAFRKALNGLELFSSLKLNIPDADKISDYDLNKPLPIVLLVEERARNFIGFGMDYSSKEKIGMNAYWGHRNLFGRGEKLKISLRLAKIGQNTFERIDNSLEVDFGKPDFLARRQDLLINSKLVNEYNNDNFDKQGLSATIGIKRKLSNQLSLSGGISGEYSVTKKADDKQETFLIGMALALKFDTTNDLLNPELGFRNTVSITPYFVIKGESENFTVGRIDSSAYFKATESGNVILAGRFATGSIYGDNLNNMPIDKKFYSGGGGSIRGYAYQLVGPLDTDKKPVGGLSFVEIGGEIRYRYQDYGIVPFVDGGNVFTTKLPKLEKTLQWAAGIGLRYYSAIGPLRVDLAFPINKRKVDDSIAFYLSIGQAF